MEIDKELLIDLLPKYNEKFAGNINREFEDFLYHRVVATLIPNELPSKNPVELQKFFIDKIFERTGVRYDKRNKTVNTLVLLSRKFHETRANSSYNKNEINCAICNVSFENWHSFDDEGVFDILNPGTFPSNVNKRHEVFRDHIVPVSKVGGNEEENFQLLCFICNSGKANICSDIDKFNLYNERIKIEKKETYFKSLKNDLVFLPNSLFYRVLNRDKHCVFCKTKINALTLVPIDADTLYTYDNLISCCYNCLKEKDTISIERWRNYC